MLVITGKVEWEEWNGVGEIEHAAWREWQANFCILTLDGGEGGTRTATGTFV